MALARSALVVVKVNVPADAAADVPKS